MSKKENGGKVGENLPAIIDKFTFLTVTDITELRENIGNDKVGPGDLDRVTVPAGKATTWELTGVDGESQSLKELTGIILHWKQIRLYWKDAYTGKGTPPDCKSLDGTTGVGNPGGVCATCPYAQWGSDDKNTGGQACKQVRLLYLMREKQLLPIIVSVPPTSIKPVRKFFLGLASEGIPYWSIVVSLGITKTKSGTGIEYSLIKPGIVMQLPKETALSVKKYADGLRSMMEEAAAVDPV